MPSWRKAPEPASGVWVAYRQTSPAHFPLSYGAGAATLRQESGRWHREGRGVAQYLALSVEAAWAERIRYESIRDEERRREERRALWEMQVADEDIADLSTFDRYVTCGLDPALAVGSHEDAWPLAYELRDAGYRGVLSPSAALDVEGAVSLTLFGERIEHRVHGPMPDPSANPNPKLWVPTVLLTDTGSPSSYAMAHTCYRTAKHRTFAT